MESSYLFIPESKVRKIKICGANNSRFTTIPLPVLRKYSKLCISISIIEPTSQIMMKISSKIMTRIIDLKIRTFLELLKNNFSSSPEKCVRHPHLLCISHCQVANFI